MGISFRGHVDFTRDVEWEEICAACGGSAPREYTEPRGWTFNFTGSITMNGSGTVTYRWERSDGVTKASQVLTFTSAGTQTITDQWASLPITITNGWQRIHVGSPNDLFSNQATFTNNCK